VFGVLQLPEQDGRPKSGARQFSIARDTAKPPMSPAAYAGRSSARCAARSSRWGKPRFRPELQEWTHSRGRGAGHNKRRSVRRVCERYCIRVGRGASIGRPILWKLHNSREK
jgi:hypothetical protein